MTVNATLTVLYALDDVSEVAPGHVLAERRAAGDVHHFTGRQKTTTTAIIIIIISCITIPSITTVITMATVTMFCFAFCVRFYKLHVCSYHHHCYQYQKQDHYHCHQDLHLAITIHDQR